MFVFALAVIVKQLDEALLKFLRDLALNITELLPEYVFFLLLWFLSGFIFPLV